MLSSNTARASWFQVEEPQRYALVVVTEGQRRDGSTFASSSRQLPVEPEVEAEPRLRLRG
jgi:hypothetical protein